MLARSHINTELMENYNQKLHQSDYEASASSKPVLNLKLIFSSDVIVSPVFTGQNISGHESLKLILIDADTQQQITTGSVAFAHVKIVLLRGNYNHATMDLDGEFEKHIVVKWGKKKKLLQGDVDVYLKHGSGTVGEIRIQHDKNPIRNVEFRLGAMVVDSCSCYDQVKVVKQAITQSFKVKDRRNAPKSFRSLLLTDKVWQLENIRKHGVIHKRLESSNVYTIMDFLYMYHFNPQTLQQIYGVRGKKWETTVNHAKTCNVGNAPRRLGSTSQLGSDTMSSSFDDGCYVPKPYENNSYGKHEMIVDDNFSVNDMDIWFHDQEGICGASTTVEGVKAKKRWMKIRTFLFSIASFMCRCDLIR